LQGTCNSFTEVTLTPKLSAFILSNRRTYRPVRDINIVANTLIY